MKKQKSFKLLLLIFLSIFAFFGCTKNGGVGMTGPVGPQGPEGNANVQSFTFLNQSFTIDSVIFFSIPAITQNTLDSGQVIGYTRGVRPGITTAWVPLPYNFFPRNYQIVAWSIVVGQASIVANFNSSSLYNFDFKFVVTQGQ